MALLFIASSFFIFVVISWLWLYRSRRLGRDIRKIIEFCDDVASASGDLNKKLLVDEGSKLSQLADHIIHMVEELKNKLIEADRKKETIELVLKNMKEGLLIIDEKDKVLLANNALLSIFGIETPYSGMTAAEILRNAEILSMIEESRDRNETVSKGISLRNDVFLSVIASPIKFLGQGNGIILTFHDITRLKRLEQIRRDFVANVAHEIKTPITAIKGFAETLIDGAIDDRENAIRFLEIIKRHSERLNSLVSDLLTLSAIEQGEIKLKIEDINLSELIDSLFSLIQEKARAKGLYIKKIIPDRIPLLKADRDRLFQILLNLIDNAIKFTDLGGVTIGAEKANQGIILFVEDTGCGIERKHLPRLGERFYRVDRARSRELGGTGLGLAIVKHLVKAHGWTMEIDSTPGKGTRVKIIMADRGDYRPHLVCAPPQQY
ncbi:MAG: sensor histidine kinase [Thermodesulfovibrionales bacterium]